MTPFDDLSPPRRPIFFPVVIATVLLTIIGLSVGFVLGEHSRDRAAADTGATGGLTGVAAPAPTPTGPPCPAETRSMAAELGLPEDIRQVFKILTDNGTTVWICHDVDDNLYYQAKTGGEDAAIEQGHNGLFLTDVQQAGDDRYEARADNGTQFFVGPDELRVTFPDGRDDQVHEVVQVG